MEELKGHGLEMERIVFFSDAVFAIAITLLIIEIKVPHLDHAATGREFWIALANSIPNFLGFFFSFFVIGAYWIGHHRIYGHILRWNYGLVWRNLFFLMAIAFMPFSTAFFAEYFPRFVPLLIYASTFSAAGLLELLQWRYAVSKKLVGEDLSPNVVSYLSWRMTTLPAVGVAAVLIGLINPMFSGFAFMMLPIAQVLIRSRYSQQELRSEKLEDESEN